MTEMTLCPYCGKLAGLVPSAGPHTLTLKRCIYCGEEVCDVADASCLADENETLKGRVQDLENEVTGLEKKLDAAMKTIWDQGCKLDKVDAFLGDLEIKAAQHIKGTCKKCGSKLTLRERHTSGHPDAGTFTNTEIWGCRCGYEEERDRS